MEYGMNNQQWEYDYNIQQLQSMWNKQQQRVMNVMEQRTLKWLRIRPTEQILR